MTGKVYRELPRPSSSIFSPDANTFPTPRTVNVVYNGRDATVSFRVDNRSLGVVFTNVDSDESLYPTVCSPYAFVRVKNQTHLLPRTLVDLSLSSISSCMCLSTNSRIHLADNVKQLGLPKLLEYNVLKNAARLNTKFNTKFSN